jgi:hypothetical protein
VVDLCPDCGVLQLSSLPCLGPYVTDVMSYPSGTVLEYQGSSVTNDGLSRDCTIGGYSDGLDRTYH